MSNIKLIVGLGNPGKEYQQTRHNVGFWFVEQLAEEYQQVFRVEKKFSGSFCRINFQSEEIFLFKPLLFMNRSGLPIKQFIQFYKIETDDIVIVHDDLDILTGSVRLKQQGGHGGHNGLRDIINQLTTKEFCRLRLGIGRPKAEQKVVDFVLSQTSKSDSVILHQAIDNVLNVLPDIIQKNFQTVMNQLHTQ